MHTDKNPKELALLNYIDHNSDATQRQLSEHVGMSLGAINLLLKKLIKKGLVKVERMQPTSVKYFLTPAGLANKIDRTYNYIVRTYNEIDQLRNTIVSATNSIAHKQNVQSIIFFGPKDDFSNMVQDLQSLGSFTVSVEILHNVGEVREATKAGADPILVWREESGDMLRSEGYVSENLVGKMVF